MIESEKASGEILRGSPFSSLGVVPPHNSDTILTIQERRGQLLSQILEWLSADEDTLVSYRLREQSLHEQASMIADAKEEGKAEGKVEGKVEMAHEAICMYLKARFGEESQGLQQQIKEISKLEVLDKIINKIYTANSLEDARAVIDGATK